MKTSKKQGMFLTVKTGLQSVFEAVVANLKEGSVSFNTQVEEIVKEGDNRYLVRLANGEKKRTVSLGAYYDTTAKSK